MNDSSSHDVEIFTEALQLPPIERAKFLDNACGADRELRKKVEALLQANDDVGEFLEVPAKDTKLFKRATSAATGVKPGDCIGHFKLLEQIGEGGCGVVYLAEQQEPIRRLVALKIIKPGMDTKSVIARFEAERQTLALMDHPNIAKVFDAGATEAGHPYFVMELIRGVKITEYCDAFSLSTEERLKLFVQVCQGVQHAHQKGIIHRDIKPSNILVTQTAENTPLPVIIDFGIAKATTNQPLTDKTLFTAFEMLIGTPAYMSPEQAAFASADLDTRTDIYSLGVLLYELIAGSTPFNTSELLKAGLDEIRRTIREEEPVRPSTRLSKMTDAELTQLAGKRRAQPPALIRAIRGDLDWIAMKALEKDRCRRYETANGLARDIQRYLANEAISARPPSKVYRFRKTVARNKLLFASIGAIAALLVASLIIVSFAFTKEKKASVKSQQVTKFLEAMLNGVGPSVARGRDKTMLLEILDATAERVGKELADQPEVEAELLSIMANLYNELGKSNEKMASRALEIQRARSGPNSRETAGALNLLGTILMTQRNVSGAEQAHSEALAIRRRLFGEENPDTATSLNNLAEVFREQRKLPEAEVMAKQGLAIRERLLGAVHLDVADSLRNLALIFAHESHYPQAEAAARRVLAIRQKLLGNEDHRVASALEDLGWVLSLTDQFDEAQAMDAEAFLIRQKLLGDAHPDVQRNLRTLGQLLMERGELETASGVLKAVIEIQRKTLGDDNEAMLETLSGLAKALQREGKLPESESSWRAALAIANKIWENDKPERLFLVRDLIECLEAEKKWPEAEALWRESLALWRKRGGVEQTESTYTLRRLGISLEVAGKWPEAEAVFREVLGLSRKNGNQQQYVLIDLDRVVRALIAQKKLSEAEQFLNEALTPAFVTEPASANLLVLRVNLNGRRGRWKEAAADARMALDNDLGEHYRHHTLAGLLAMIGDRSGYVQTCERLVAKFSDSTNPYICERITQDCLLLPDSGADLALIDRLADKAVTAGAGTDDLPYFQACKAMSHYRQGNFPEAVLWGQKAAVSSTGFAQAKAFAIIAMANWRLGDETGSRAALIKGNTLAPRLSAEPVDLGESWVAWLMARISLDEASKMIDPKIYEEKN